MSISHGIRIAVVAAVFFGVGCRIAHPTWTPSVAFDRAQRYAALNQIDLNEYEPPEIRFKGRVQYKGQRGFWSLWFWPKSRIEGGDLKLIIHEQTGKVYRLPVF